MFRMFPTLSTNLNNYKHNLHIKALQAQRVQLK
jgi:hypothetical protein